MFLRQMPFQVTGFIPSESESGNVFRIINFDNQSSPNSRF